MSVINSLEDLVAHSVVHDLASFPEQKDQIDVRFIAERVFLHAVQIQLFLEVQDDFIVQLGYMLPQLVAHNLELRHHCAIIQAGDPEVGHELVGDL